MVKTKFDSVKPSVSRVFTFSFQVLTRKTKKQNMSFSGTETRYFPINDRHVGFVIGKKGATIKMIKHKSGAYVQIRKPEPAEGRNLPYFEVIGSGGQCQRAMELLCQISNEAVHRENGGVPTPGSRTQYQVAPMFSRQEFPSLPTKSKFIPNAQDQMEIDGYLNEEINVDRGLNAIRAELEEIAGYDQWKRDAGVDALCQSEVDDLADERYEEHNRAVGDQVDNVPSHPSMKTKTGGCYMEYHNYNGYPMGYWKPTN